MSKLQFKPIQNRTWTGRYARIPGDISVFRVASISSRYQTAVYLVQDDAKATCVAVDTPAIRKLTEAVSRAKQQLGGGSGGSFQINEFGQVLVPASRGGQRMIAGEVSGPLCFHNPFEDGETFCLGDAEGLSTGDDWSLPYVGMPYNLSKRHQIYYWDESNEKGRAISPPVEDKDLIEALRSIRSYGAMRFIVNPSGVILTKRPPAGKWQGGQENWEPVYVGRINYSKWFDKEN